MIGYGQGLGSPLGHEAIYLRRYDEHNRDVTAYFARRPHDLLALRITEGEGWDALCSFLAGSLPWCRFPHINASPQGSGAQDAFASYRRWSVPPVLAAHDT